MKPTTSAQRWALIALTAVTALGFGACAPRNDDINRVQPGYVRKDIFQTQDEWYYRRTVVKSETTNAITIEGAGDGYLTRIKFEIQEKQLLARKAYEGIPGSDGAAELGDNLYKGVVIAAWPIESHFDIQRGYDPKTGNVSNVIDENSTDRPWYERSFMRVDWSNNLIEDSQLAGNPLWDLLPIKWVSTHSSWSDLETKPTDPYASRFSKDYIEVTQEAMLGMDILTCASFSGYNFASYTACGYGEAQIRHAFLRIKEKSDYIPRDYPDSVVRTDASGHEMLDPVTGEVKREPISARFGYFRIELPVHSQRYGDQESTRLYRATLHNLWEKQTDGQGNMLPYKDRTPKPIIYYLNAEYPARWRSIATEKLQGEYNKAFKGIVADLMEKSESDVPDMFQVRVNDCNEEHIIQFVKERPELQAALARGACKEGQDCDVSTPEKMAAHIGIGNLEKVCTSLESATLNVETGISEFNWQRIGDSRYNMVVWFNNPQQSGWGGLGPMHADERTGEIVSASAFLRPAYYRLGAANVADYVAFINDEIDVPAVIYGQTIRRAMKDKLETYQRMVNQPVGDAYLKKMDLRLDANGRTPETRLREQRGDDQLARLKMLQKDSKILSALRSNEDILLASAGQKKLWRPGQPVTEALLERSTPYERAVRLDPASPKNRRFLKAASDASMCFLQHEFDADWAGMAERVKDLNKEERYNAIFTQLFGHVMLHEVGHNMGLRHNYEGTYDALNFSDKFWEQHCFSGEGRDCTSQETITAQNKNGYREERNTTVMEYVSAKGAFQDYLGRYDVAALRFGYANQVEVFDNDAMTVKGGDTLRQWRYLNHFSDIPGKLCGDAGCADAATARNVIKARKWVSFDPQNPPEKEVPYLYCSDEFRGATPFCNAFDYGPGVREIMANYYTTWKDYYYFNNFTRDRTYEIGWTLDSALGPVYRLFLYQDTLAHYLVMLDVLNPEFKTSRLKDDLKIAVGHGMNAAMEIVSLPNAGRMCPIMDGTTPITYSTYMLGNACSATLPIDSDAATAAMMIDVPHGEGRPMGMSYTDDYENYGLAFVGSYFDKSNTAFLIARTRPSLLRFNYHLDRRNYYVGNYSIFGKEIRGIYDVMMHNRTLVNYADLTDTASEAGSYWCRDPQNPTVASAGYVEPRRAIDLQTGKSLPGPSANCQQPTPIYPELAYNAALNAVVYGNALLSSDFDGQLDYGTDLRVYAAGAADEIESWNALPLCSAVTGTPACRCEYTDSMSGVTYRTLKREGLKKTMTCTLMSLAKEQEAQASGTNASSFTQDVWRGTVDRLEMIRRISRVFTR